MGPRSSVRSLAYSADPVSDSGLATLNADAFVVRLSYSEGPGSRDNPTWDGVTRACIFVRSRIAENCVAVRSGWRTTVLQAACGVEASEKPTECVRLGTGAPWRIEPHELPTRRCRITTG